MVVRGFETVLGEREKVLTAAFYVTAAGNEPVRAWLRSFDDVDRKIIGRDMTKVEYGWPMGMPLCRPMGKGLYELRSNLVAGRIARILFCPHDGKAYMLHGFVKKTQTTPKADLDLARERMKEVKNA